MKNKPLNMNRYIDFAKVTNAANITSMLNSWKNGLDPVEKICELRGG